MLQPEKGNSVALYYTRNVEKDQEYWWCACGRSADQPFCDGSHKGTGVSPVQYVGKRDQAISFCGCKRTGNAPLCDGSHEL
jgi:CDGSH iron-sulfur domain-containing protein 3